MVGHGQCVLLQGSMQPHTVAATTKVAPGVHGIEVDYFQVCAEGPTHHALTLSAWWNRIPGSPYFASAEQTTRMHCQLHLLIAE